MDILTLLVGILLLVLGRKLFWLFVGAIGFIAGLNLVPQLLPDQPPWLVLLIAIIAGVIGAVIAVFLQRLAVGIAGFFAGGYILISLLQVLGVDTGQLYWLFYLIGGIIGGILMFVLFDWALIILSSLAGAALIVQSLNLAPATNTIVYLVLILVGILIQAGWMRSEPGPPVAEV